MYETYTASEARSTTGIIPRGTMGNHVVHHRCNLFCSINWVPLHRWHIAPPRDEIRVFWRSQTPPCRWTRLDPLQPRPNPRSPMSVPLSTPRPVRTMAISPTLTQTLRFLARFCPRKLRAPSHRRLTLRARPHWRSWGAQTTPTAAPKRSILTAFTNTSKTQALTNVG